METKRPVVDDSKHLGKLLTREDSAEYNYQRLLMKDKSNEDCLRIQAELKAIREEYKRPVIG